MHSMIRRTRERADGTLSMQATAESVHCKSHHMGLAKVQLFSRVRDRPAVSTCALEGEKAYQADAARNANGGDGHLGN
jgi:hypothetical protein